MTETTKTITAPEAFAPPAPTPPAVVRRLPGADRARAFTEPPPAGRPTGQLELPDVLKDAPADTAGGAVSWDRFTHEPEPTVAADRVPGSESTDAVSTGVLSTDALTQGGWVPPAPPEPPAEWGRRRTVIKVLSLGLATPKPGREELAHRHNVRTIRQATWPRAVRIAVTNPKGGSGKTPTTVILGGLLASIRGGSVAIWDAADAAGTLGGRTEGVAARCVSDIDADPAAYTAPSTVGMVAATQTSFADVLSSLREREFTGDSIDRVTDVLDRTYRISVADTGNVPHSAAFTRTIALADILVIPTTVTADSVNKAVGLLRRLQDTPTGLAQHAVVAVLHTRGPETPGLASQITTIFGNAGVGAVVDIPFDPHIAAGTAISIGSLSHPSRVAWTRLAAATVANLTTTTT